MGKRRGGVEIGREGGADRGNEDVGRGVADGVIKGKAVKGDGRKAGEGGMGVEVSEGEIEEVSRQWFA